VVPADGPHHWDRICLGKKDVGRVARRSVTFDFDLDRRDMMGGVATGSNQAGFATSECPVLESRSALSRWLTWRLEDGVGGEVVEVLLHASDVRGASEAGDEIADLGLSVCGNGISRLPVISQGSGLSDHWFRRVPAGVCYQH
jgi:hypothetical protein